MLLIWMPSAEVLMAENSPCTGRPGLGSHVSMWLMPPLFQNRITCPALEAAALLCAARRRATGIPKIVAPVACNMRRRVKW